MEKQIHSFLRCMKTLSGCIFLFLQLIETHRVLFMQSQAIYVNLGNLNAI